MAKGDLMGKPLAAILGTTVGGKPMSDKKWIVGLSEPERERLHSTIKKGHVGGRTLNRCHILLLADEGQPDDRIAAALHTGVSTVERTRRKCVEGGVDHALSERARPKRGTKLDAHGRAMLVATACSTPPNGRPRWTMQLLANRLVELHVVDQISDETVRTELKKTTSSPGRPSNGVFRLSPVSL
jgi:transposase